MLEQYRARGDARMVKALEAAPITVGGVLPEGYVAVREQAMHALGVGLR